MPITKHGIKSLGFTEIPAGTKIEATFNYVAVYKVEGINLKESAPETFSDLSHQGSEFSFSFGNSINALSRKLCGDDFVDDESDWEEKNSIKSPYFIIRLKIKEPYFCSAGYWKRDKDKLFTYDCFPNAKQAIKDYKKIAIPRLISSLTVQLSKIHDPIRFKFVEHLVYGETSEGEFLVDMRLDISARASIIKDISPSEIKGNVDYALEHYLELPSKVGSLLYSGLSEEDKFKKFLNLYQALEIYTHKTFNQINIRSHVDKVSPPFARLEETFRNFYIERYSESKNLTQRFTWCAILIWENLEDSDVEKFKQIKKCRDKLSHGEEISETTLPVEDLENLLFKIL